VADSESVARLKIEITENVAKVMAGMRSLREELQGAGGDSNDLTRAMAGVEKAMGGTGKEAREATKDVAKYADGFGELVKELNEFKKASKEQAQLAVVSGKGNGTDRANLEKLDIKDLKEYIAVQTARGDTTISVAKQIVKAYDDEQRAIREATKAAAEQKAAAQASRGYSNLSVDVDQGIDQRKKAGQDYATSLKAEMTARERGIETLHSEANAINKTVDKRRAATVAAQEAQKGTTVLTKAQSDLANKVKSSTGVMEQHTTSIIAARYALYDVSSSVGAVGIAFAAAFTVAAGSAIMFEASFADVRRTTGVTGEAADDLYARFKRLSTEIPVSFKALSEIGTAAGQLGVADEKLASFTKTVAMFSATTDVTVDAAGTAFGRLDALVEGVDGQYGKLASSILNVGINSVATESEIISITSQIAATGSQAGLTADEIVGLSASLASLGVAPEAARGTILRVFSKINAAVASGGTTLNDFAGISKMTSEQFKDGWGSDFTSTFLALLDGMESSAGGAEVGLRSLGITATRDVNAMLKLAQNTDALKLNLALAATGFESTAVLTDNFGIIAETTAARVQILGQTFQALMASIGESSTGPMGHFIDLTTDLMKAFIELNSTPLGQTISFIGLGMTGLVAVLAIVIAAAARGTASFLALRTALGSVNLEAALAAGGMRGFGASMLGAAGAAGVFGAALKATGVGAVITLGALGCCRGCHWYQQGYDERHRSGHRVLWLARGAV